MVVPMTVATSSHVFVVWMSGRVLLMVDGPIDPAFDPLVEDCKRSLRESGVPDEDVDVIWQRPPAAQGTSL
jgi:hypothetical protein